MSNQQQTVLVTGATGLLGRQIVRAFEKAGWRTVGTGFSRAGPSSPLKLDLCDAAAVEKVLNDVKPHVIVHSAAQRAPDKVEADPDGSRALNVTSTASLARQTCSRQIFLLYISTDYVFPGAPGEAPYSAASTPGPTNLYGQMKLDGEKAVIDETSPRMGVVLRVPVLYGSISGDGKEGRQESAVNTLLDKVYDAQVKEIIMDDWSQRYPTCTEDVGRVCKDISRLYSSTPSASSGVDEKAPNLPRILQFTAEQRMTKYRMCEIFADILGLPMGQMKANKEGNDPRSAVQRPYDTHLTTEELKGLGISILCQSFEAWFRKETGAYKK